MAKAKPQTLPMANASYGSKESPAQQNTMALTTKALKLLGANKPYGNT